MAAATKNFDAPPASKSKKSSDSYLHQRLTRHLDVLKHPNDLVRITQVSPAHFRVNTLSPTSADDSLLSTYRIVKSQFLHVADAEGELVITDQTRP